LNLPCPSPPGIDDFTFPCLLARRTKAYAQKYPHFQCDDLGPIVAKAYKNGNKNPKAHMHTVKVPIEKTKAGEKNPNFLSNEDFKEYCRMTDCSQVSDGGSAILLASEEGRGTRSI
jgi:acetyl-CoA acyltransferase